MKKYLASESLRSPLREKLPAHEGPTNSTSVFGRTLHSPVPKKLSAISLMKD